MADVNIEQLSGTQQEALQQYMQVTNQEVKDAIPLLERSQWNVQVGLLRSNRMARADSGTLDRHRQILRRRRARPSRPSYGARNTSRIRQTREPPGEPLGGCRNPVAGTATRADGSSSADRATAAGHAAVTLGCGIVAVAVPAGLDGHCNPVPNVPLRALVPPCALAAPSHYKQRYSWVPEQ